MALFEKSGNISRVNREISKQLEDINRKYTEIGRIVKLNCLSQVHNDDVQRLAREIDLSLANLKKLQEELNVINGIKICPKCNAQIDINVAFCPSCGTKQNMAHQAAPAQPVPVQPVPVQPVPMQPVPVQPVPASPAAPPSMSADASPIPEQTNEAVSETTQESEKVSPVPPSIDPPSEYADESIPEPATPPAAGQSVIFCTQCGSKEPAGTRFCSQCGSPM